MKAISGALSLQQAPPISVPFRFFLSAPLFLLAAALILLFAGPQAVASRWTPAMLALTHLLTLGFMTMNMLGALMQMLPVVADSPMTRPVLISWLVHVPLTAGTAMLAAGLFFSQPGLLDAAMILLGFAFAVFLGSAAYGFAARVSNDTTRAIRFAGIALALTAVIGIALAGTLTGLFKVSIRQFLPLHAAWGLPGWTGLLVIGVAYQVVPMFQLTPAYPRRLARWLVEAVFWLLLALSLASLPPFFPAARAAMFAQAGIAAAYAVFAVATLQLQQKRRRRIGDVTLQFWRIGMVSLLAAALLSLSAQVLRGISADPRYPIALGVLFIAGFAVSVISGMLYKIVPFLVWFHLNAQAAAGRAVPNMTQIMPDSPARRQMQSHLAALLLLLSSLEFPLLFYPAAFMLGLAACLLWLNLFAAMRLYLNYLRR
ncbi:MAG TPA: hypothetical protein VFN66_00855 [Burkholderiales bacterium]|nr:hypothetical protein [Burkholderiales bacterium]